MVKKKGKLKVNMICIYIYISKWCDRKKPTWLRQMKERVVGATGDNENLMRKQRTEQRLALFFC